MPDFNEWAQQHGWKYPIPSSSHGSVNSNAEKREVTPPLGPIVAPPSAMGPSVCSKLKDNVDFVYEETPDV